MKNQVEKTAYETPVVEVFEVIVEKGFAASSGDGGQTPDYDI